MHSAHRYHAQMAEADVDPVLLRTFLSVRRHGNLTRAAEELFVTQPAVTRRLERLERALGFPVFERLGRALHATAAGEALVEEATAMVGAMDRLGESLRARRAGARGRLRVGASTTPGLYVLPAVLRAFEARHPEVDLTFVLENSHQVGERLVRNELDVGLVGAVPPHGSLRLDRLFEDEVVWYAAPTHPLAAGRGGRAPRDLAGTACFVREPGSATRRLVDAWLRRARARLGRTVCVACPEAAKRLARAGLGVAYGSARGLEGEGGAGLARVPVSGPRMPRPVFRAVHVDKRATRETDAFDRLLRETLAPRSPAPR
jgi:DNA-binding transcriptional LysR family regulator